MTDFELIVNKSKYSGWKTLSIRRSIEELAHSYRVDLTDRWSENQERVPIVAGDECSVRVDRKTITTGYVDDDGLRYDANSRTLTFSGRSKTCDPVDCAAIYKTGQWRKKGLLTIANDLLSPYGIDVRTNTLLGKVFSNPKFSIQDGETAFECLSRAAQMRGVIMLTDANGDVVFDRAGSSRVRTVIERGVNVLSGSKQNSMKDRFSHYTVKAQMAGDDDAPGKTRSITRTSIDEGVPRYRPTILMADSEDSGEELQKRADWERNVRAGRALRLSYRLQGWSHSTGLWDPNTLARVKDSELQIDDELLIVSTEFTRSNSGTFTDLELTMKEAFDIQPLPKPKRKAGSLR